MKIRDIRIRVCRNHREVSHEYQMRSGGKSGFEFIVVSMETDNGLTGNSFGFAGRGASVAGEIAATALKPFFLGKDALARERH